MNRPPTTGTDEFPAIDLARETPIMLGRLAVAPATLSVAAGAWSQRLEPRAMKTLVVLAQAMPEVVGRAEINARAWDGRIIGDDAINRAVQTLRRVAADVPGDAPFTIETVPRVGYRLVVPPAGPSAAMPPPPVVDDRARTNASRVPRSWLALVAILLVVGVAWWGISARRPAERNWTVAESSTLTDLPPGARDTALSPDGRRTAYRARDAEGRERIFIRASDDGGPGTPVSPAGADARRPAWSPDGTRLAFALYDAGRPCALYVARPGAAATLAGRCETVRDPRLAWSADGQSILFGDAPGENAVQRIGAIRLEDGRRTVLSSPPGDSMGDALPVARARDVVFQRQFGWADEGWIARDNATGAERLLWRKRGIAGSVAAMLPDGSLAIAWTKAGMSRLDFVAPDGAVTTQPMPLGPVTVVSAAGNRLVIEADRTAQSLVRAEGNTVIATTRGSISGPKFLPDGRLLVPVTAAGLARVWQLDSGGALRPWGRFTAARLSGLATTADGHFTAALATGEAGREIVVLDARGEPVYRWNPHARSLNPAAWMADGRHLVVPVLDGAGWRLYALDPFGRGPPRDTGQPGFAVVQSVGAALYAVRAGETTGVRELWRLDGGARRLPIDLTLFDIVNWVALDDGVWLANRTGPAPRLELRDSGTGRVLRAMPAPGLAGAGSGLAADTHSPVYVRPVRDDPEHGVLRLTK